VSDLQGRPITAKKQIQAILIILCSLSTWTANGNSIPPCVRLLGEDGILNTQAIANYLGLKQEEVSSIFSENNSPAQDVLLREIMRKLDEMRLGCDYAVACNIQKAIKLVRESVNRLYSIPEDQNTEKIMELSNLISKVDPVLTTESTTL
jgi:hypothetical protein